MPLSPKLEAKLSKPFAPDSRLDDTFSGKDITFITDRQGHAITLFIGKRRPDGSINGERYVRRLQVEADGVTIKSSHWENKGKVTRS
ncbi:hypothetical protein ACD591_15515 [Rufibacter glacialis]|uniref:Uncharacterized protein n=1 Tax=Rufibacter glacialis TaxID=1259555 RepID=A0A5M8QRG0_9BACT|nr:hypothetical protein [Rufibacter glacialis]KAA6437640.1 hypothetical protein FOE74_03825 [Rufibacter glacialis]GGK57616.1 hypothetical protein GCM10011405_02110 [Rufibacter glacialis]